MHIVLQYESKTKHELAACRKNCLQLLHICGLSTTFRALIIIASVARWLYNIIPMGIECLDNLAKDTWAKSLFVELLRWMSNMTARLSLVKLAQCYFEQDFFRYVYHNKASHSSGSYFIYERGFLKPLVWMLAMCRIYVDSITKNCSVNVLLRVPV